MDLLRSTHEEVRAPFFELQAKADASPIEFEGFRVNGTFFTLLNFSFLYSDATLPDIGRLWQAVRDSSSSAALASGTEAAASGFPEIPPDNIEMSGGAVLCGDIAWSRSVEQYRREVAADRQKYPMFGALGSHIWPCAFWPNPPSEPPVRLRSHAANGILILNTLRDPATPLPAAQRMRAVLGQRPRLVLADQGGHAIFGFSDNVCITETVASYLSNGIFPPADATCPANPPGVTAQAQSELRLQTIKQAPRYMTPLHR